jgi:hypothetical protein
MTMARKITRELSEALEEACEWLAGFEEQAGFDEDGEEPVIAPMLARWRALIERAKREAA